MTSDIGVFVASVKAAYDIAKGIGSMKIQVERDQALSKVVQILLSVESDAIAVKEKYYTMLEEKNALAEKVVKLEDWKLTEKRYGLQEIHRGVFVYALKESAQNKEPAHWLCTNCWSQKKKSILQAQYNNSSAASYVCPGCQTRIHWKKDSGDTDDYDLNDGYRRGAY